MMSRYTAGPILANMKMLRPGESIDLRYSTLDDCVIPWEDRYVQPSRDQKIGWFLDQLSQLLGVSCMSYNAIADGKYVIHRFG